MSTRTINAIPERGSQPPPGSPDLGEWPASGLWVIGMFVAIDMIFGGSWLIMLALNARRASRSGTQGRPTVQLSATLQAQPIQP